MRSEHDSREQEREARAYEERSAMNDESAKEAAALAQQEVWSQEHLMLHKSITTSPVIVVATSHGDDICRLHNDGGIEIGYTTYSQGWKRKLLLALLTDAWKSGYIGCTETIGSVMYELDLEGEPRK